MPKTKRRRRILRILAVVTVLVTAGAAGVATLIDRSTTIKVTAYFTAAVGLFSGSDVRVLGVPVGSIDTVEPQGERVKVTMTVDASIPIPEAATALVVTPSLVSDRYVQLAPVYTDGPRMLDGTEIALERTVVPVELDELFASLDRLTTALGPDGANAKGDLANLLTSAAANLKGNGRSFGEAIRELGKATHTLSGSEQDLFATVDNLQKFAAMLAVNDKQVARFATLLAQVSDILADEREAFGAALSELAGALGPIQDFIRDNRGRIKSNVDKLVGTSKVLADQRASLSEAIDTAPGALAALLGGYDPKTGTLDSRANLNEFTFGTPVGGAG